MLQGIIVSILVIGASAYAAWALMPSATRLRLAGRFRDWTRAREVPAWLEKVSVRLENRAQTRLGGCERCPAAARDSDKDSD